MRIVPLLILLVFIVAILFAPVSIDWKLTSIGQVFPQKAWKITQDATGNLLINLTNFQTGETTTSSNYQFERGDLVQASLRPGQTDSAALVKKGDTLLVIRTTRIEDRLTTLRGELAEAQSQLASGATGEKTPIVEQAENRVRFDEQELANQKTTQARFVELFKTENVSAQQLENATNALQKAEIQLEIDKKNLETVRTGLKPSEIEVLKTSIQNLAGQIQFLEKQTTKYVLTAPFDGWRRRAALTGEVFTLHSATDYFLQIPLKIEDLRWVTAQTPIEITDAQTGKSWPARFIRIAPSVEVLSGRRTQMLEASVAVPLGEQLSTGLSVNAVVHCGGLNVRDYLRRVLNFQ